MPNKLCSKCKITKPIDDFNFKIKAKGIRQLYCRECGKAYTRADYKKKKSTYIKRAKKRTAKQKKLLYAWLLEYLLHHPCVDCGEKDPRVLEFDHLHSKSTEISKILCSASSLDKLKSEIKKCEVRCCNCHRRHTQKQNKHVRASWENSILD